jgi:hypothetical protein
MKIPDYPSDMESPDFPASFEIQSKHIGSIGEAIIGAKVDPPEPIGYAIADFCREVAPDFVEVSNLGFNFSQNKRMFIVEHGENTYKWESDGSIDVQYRHRKGDFEARQKIKNEYGTTTWAYEFPVEIKSGGAKLDYKNQRKVMEYYSGLEAIQPVYISIIIIQLPDKIPIYCFHFIGIY